MPSGTAFDIEVRAQDHGTEFRLPCLSERRAQFDVLSLLFRAQCLSLTVGLLEGFAGAGYLFELPIPPLFQFRRHQTVPGIDLVVLLERPPGFRRFD